ncbi:MAG: DUF1573 domain-containing protein [Rikenellaceae bacterium]|nr:DUF1573 domain-containing protein [Rikenellaceae bacterium]
MKTPTNIFRSLAAVLTLMTGGFDGLVTATAQQSQVLHFEHSTWNFGDIREIDGTVCHTFRATNLTDLPIVIERIYTSCGCTSTEYSTHPIKPGEMAEVKVCFDPVGREGEFDKRVNIILNGNRRETISVCGVVEGRPRTVEDEYPYYMVSGLRVDNTTFGMGTVQHGSAQSTVVNYINTSEQEIRPRVKFTKRSGVLRVTLPERIAPGERGQITLTYDLTIENKLYGNVVDKFTIESAGKHSAFPIYVAVIAVEDMTTADIETAPVARFSKRLCDWGVVAPDCGVLHQTVTLTNNGDEKLIVRWVEQKDTGILVTLRPGTIVPAGGSTTFEVTLDTEHYPMAEIYDAVGIVTNDPIQPYRQIKAQARREMK